LKVSSRQAHVMTARKASWFAAWRHEAPVTWRPNWRFPRSSLAYSAFDPFHTRVFSECKKSVRLPIKGDERHL
jgi:hypothetical protein